MTNKIIWEVHDHDGQPDWRGYVDGEELYRVYLGGFSSELDPDFHDTFGNGGPCEDAEIGKDICQRHLNGE